MNIELETLIGEDISLISKGEEGSEYERDAEKLHRFLKSRIPASTYDALYALMKEQMDRDSSR